MTESRHPSPFPDFPSSLLELEQRFPDEDACAAYLRHLRWPDGFVCPHCGSRRAWELNSKKHCVQCANCKIQTSIRAGTIMHKSHLPLRTWFWAAWLMASHSNGISAVQLQRQLGLGSYKTAWLLLAKLRRAMVDPDRQPLAGVVEIDEATMPYQRKDDPVGGGQGRSMKGKMAMVAAVEADGERIGRLRLQPIGDYCAKTLGAFTNAVLAPEALMRTDGWASYPAIAGHAHSPIVVGPMAAHVVLDAIHKVFGNLKAWARGVYHGLRPKHLQSYLDEFVFRFNRRRKRHVGVRSLLRLGMNTSPKPYARIISHDTRE